MMFVSLTILFHSTRQMIRQQLTHELQQAVGQVLRQERQSFEKLVASALHVEEGRQPSGSEFLNHQEGIFAVFLGNVESASVHILASYWQVREVAQDAATQPSQLGWIIRPDVVDLRTTLNS